MIKANIAIHKDLDGEISVLVLSEDADKAIAAVKGCETPGEAAFFRLNASEKTKAIKAKPVATKAAKKAPKSQD